MKQKKLWNSLGLIFLLALGLRIYSIYPYNTIIGFDQARDLFDSTVIFRDFNLRFIGPTAGNNPNLHHGVLYLYYSIPGLIIFGGNPIGIAFWNSFWNAGVSVLIYFLYLSLFKDKRGALVSSILVAVSYYFISFSGWLSNPTPTLFTVPLCFFGFWQYYKTKKWGLVVFAFALSLSVQFELFFIYLIPVFVLLWVVLRPKAPTIKLAFTSVMVAIGVLSTMILTEIKYNFAGVFSLLASGNKVGGDLSLGEKLGAFSSRFGEVFSNTLLPLNTNLGSLLALGTLGVLCLYLYREKKVKEKQNKLIFLLIYLLSPATMLLLGYHNAPWFLIGLPPAIALSSAFILSRLKSNLLLTSALLLISSQNILGLQNIVKNGQTLLEPDPSAKLANQIEVMNYTYESSEGEKFSINTVTNPLYINALWGYNYYWYGKRYGYLPTWTGGDQLHPYDTLTSRTNEELNYLILDTTSRIPDKYREEAINSVKAKGKFIEEKNFGGWKVQKWLLDVSLNNLLD